MLLNDQDNTIFQKAVAFVNQTNRHLFLTGKAGTGKTTFLKYIRENSFKKMAVVAPTGVAAINAGGVTIHSFFQLPMGAFIPTQTNNFQTFDGRVNNLHSLFKNMRMTTARRELLRELDLLIIDEVSMVRADVLDMIDAVLRNIRKQPLVPFGGVQMLYIGDLFQLPPVVKNDEWDVLRDHYKSPFFFDAQVLQHATPVFIELKKIYRQSDKHFIDILNNVRNNTCSAADLHELQKYYTPNYEPSTDEGFITLTSHNAKADAINEKQLAQLPAKQHTYDADIIGDFYENMFPVDQVISLKEGAQIMFIKNDKGDARRFYNGKIGTITQIDSTKIVIAFAGEKETLELQKEKWSNVRYNYNQENDKIDEEELGSFSQYPIRLAWAITIHKSQGLTFDKAIIDAGASFAPGQVYVALSRLTNLQGLVLHSQITPQSISTDRRVLDFVKNEMQEDALQQILEAEQKSYVRYMLLQGFNWSKLDEVFTTHYQEYEHRQIPEKNVCIEWANKLNESIARQVLVANNFIKKLEFLFLDCEVDHYEKLLERTTAAARYFIKEIDENILVPLKQHITVNKFKSKAKKYVKELYALQLLVERKKQQVKEALQIAEALHKAMHMDELLQLVEGQHKPQKIEVIDEDGLVVKQGKAAKGDSFKMTLQLFKQGISIPDIAAKRNLSVGTIESHLANFVTSGEVDILDLVPEKKLKVILQAIDKNPGSFATAIKELLGNAYSYGEIRAAFKFHQKK